MIIDSEQKIIEGLIIDRIIDENKSLSYDEIFTFLKTRYASINQKKIEKILNIVLKKSRIIVKTDNGYTLNEVDKTKLEKKYNVIINYLKKNEIVLTLTSGALALATFSTVGYVIKEKQQERINQQYNNSIIKYDNQIYGIDEIQVVYKNNKAYFCVKKLNDNNSYSFYDIKTQNIICNEDDDNYDYDNLSDISIQEILNSNGNKMKLEKLEEQIIYDYLKNKKHIKRK